MFRDSRAWLERAAFGWKHWLALRALQESEIGRKELREMEVRHGAALHPFKALR